MQRSPIASLVSPYEALTLLVTAIGHDVGHPGVNNGFLTTLNAPLAQLYNDRSVLESFHCAAFSQILRRYWPAVFEDRKMRGLMISSILATDMGLHFDYMKKMATLKENPANWNGRQVEDAKVLACSLLIKCADISNVVCTVTKWRKEGEEEKPIQRSPIFDILSSPSPFPFPFAFIFHHGLQNHVSNLTDSFIGTPSINCTEMDAYALGGVFKTSLNGGRTRD